MAELIDIFRALADPTRLRIIALLRKMELAIGELAVVLDQSQPRVSRHVRILVEAGVVEKRREGSWVFLRIPAETPVGAIIGGAGEWPFSPREALVIAYDAERLAAVREERAAAAERYFAEHAAEWDAIRSRHVAESDGRNVREHGGYPFERLRVMVPLPAATVAATVTVALTTEPAGIGSTGLKVTVCDCPAVAPLGRNTVVSTGPPTMAISTSTSAAELMVVPFKVSAAARMLVCWVSCAT